MMWLKALTYLPDLVALGIDIYKLAATPSTKLTPDQVHVTATRARSLIWDAAKSDSGKGGGNHG